MKLGSEDFHQLFQTSTWGWCYKWFVEESNLVNLHWIFSKAVNQITSEQECLPGSAWKRVKAFVGVTMVFTKVISKLLRPQSFVVIRKNLNGTITVFAECHCKFKGLVLGQALFISMIFSIWVKVGFSDQSHSMPTLSTGEGE